MSNGGLISGSFSSDTTLSVPVAINKGGTGQTTAQAALDALAAASGSLVQGDIFIVDSSLNVVRLARGSDNQTLLMNGSNPNWETVSAGATTSEVNATITSPFTTTSTTFTDLTGLSVTVLNSAGGAVLVSATLSVKRSTTGGLVFALENDGTRISQSWIGIEVLSADAYDAVSLGTSLESDGSAVSASGKTGGGTLTIGGSTSANTSSINCIGVA